MSSYQGRSSVDVCTRTCADFPNDKLVNNIMRAEGKQLHSNSCKGAYEPDKTHPCAFNMNTKFRIKCNLGLEYELKSLTRLATL